MRVSTPKSALPWHDVDDADDHHDDQAGGLDERHQHVDHHRLGDADVVDHDQERHEDERDQQRRRARPELGEVGREAGGQRARRGQAGGQERHGDEERQRPLAEGLVDVERGTGRLGVLGDQLGVRRPVMRRDRDAEGEGDPERAADLGRDQADEHVDARSEHVAEDVEEQETTGDRPLEAASLSSTGRASDGRVCHPVDPTGSGRGCQTSPHPIGALTSATLRAGGGPRPTSSARGGWRAGACGAPRTCGSRRSSPR